MCNEFRLSRTFRATAIVGLVFFGVMFADGLYAVTTEVPEANIGGAFLAAILPWLLGIGGSLWLLFASWRKRLVTSAAGMLLLGVFAQKRVAFSDIVEARWRRWPKLGSLVLKSATGKVSIWFGNYEAKERQELVLLLRSTIAPSTQQGWPSFYSRYRSLLEVSAESDERTAHNKKLLTRRGLDRCFLVLLIPAITYAALCWWFTAEAGYLRLPLLVLLFWFSSRFLLPERGVAIREFLDACHPTASGVFALVWGAIGVGAFLAYCIFKQGLAWPRLTLLVGYVVYVVAYLPLWLLGRRWAAQRERETTDVSGQERCQSGSSGDTNRY